MSKDLMEAIPPWAKHRPKIVLLDRGQCSFVTKVRHAQDAGAIAVIIMDNINEDISKIVLSDDGNGAGIKIPSVMISKKDGDTIKQFIKENLKGHLSALLDFDLPNPDNHVE